MNRGRKKASLENTRKKVGKAIHEYSLLEENDRLLLGVSGGIDSLAMLEIIANRRRSIPFQFEMKAIHVQIEDLPNVVHLDYIRDFCQKQNIELIIIKTKADFDRDDKKSRCFQCAWSRRKIVFQTAVNQNFNKVAFGHQMDDALETLLMNMVYHGEFSSLPPKLFIQKGGFSLIRPMILLEKKEIKKYAGLLEIVSAEGECPFSVKNKREEFREIVGQLSFKHKLAKINLFNSMSNVNKEYLP
jgi:tRNA 2-thiocytidine biosynthesis protein TtcA